MLRGVHLFTAFAKTGYLRELMKVFKTFYDTL